MQSRDVSCRTRVLHALLSRDSAFSADDYDVCAGVRSYTSSHAASAGNRSSCPLQLARSYALAVPSARPAPRSSYAAPEPLASQRSSLAALAEPAKVASAAWWVPVHGLGNNLQALPQQAVAMLAAAGTEPATFALYTHSDASAQPGCSTLDQTPLSPARWGQQHLSPYAPKSKTRTRAHASSLWLQQDTQWLALSAPLHDADLAEVVQAAWPDGLYVLTLCIGSSCNSSASAPDAPAQLPLVMHATLPEARLAVAGNTGARRALACRGPRTTRPAGCSRGAGSTPRSCCGRRACRLRRTLRIVSQPSAALRAAAIQRAAHCSLPLQAHTTTPNGDRGVWTTKSCSMRVWSCRTRTWRCCSAGCAATAGGPCGSLAH
jgi:hypothetical protein